MPVSVKQTILVVDDTPENIDVISGVLRPHYKVKAATSGEKALAIVVKAKKPDLILRDIMMPEMDGYEVCERLRADLLTRDIPIIFITARSESEDIAKGLERGAVDYVRKPVKPAELLSRVKAHLPL